MSPRTAWILTGILLLTIWLPAIAIHAFAS